MKANLYSEISTTLPFPAEAAHRIFAMALGLTTCHAFSFVAPPAAVQLRHRLTRPLVEDVLFAPFADHPRAVHMQMALSSKTLQYSEDVPYKEADYQPAAADAFFRARPLESLRRLAQLAQLSGGFICALLLDKWLKREEDPAVIEARSQQLLALVTSLGPTFIKVGQALSIRTDLLPAPYVAGLTQLQDAVPPFEGALGRAIIESELGINLDRTFSKISLEPVASASIGQVYKATLREGGQEVAIKVQRPQVLYNVALDLFMLREILVPLYQRVNPESNTDLRKLVDAWGEGFVNELDYTLEAKATADFSAAMAERSLGSVIAPQVI